MTAPPLNVGAWVLGAPTSPRALVQHADLLTAYADGAVEDEREAYLSHYAFGPEMRAHYAANRNSVAGFAGSCWCRWLVLDIDRADDLPAALSDARRLVAFLNDRYTDADGEVPVYFSGGKGFHVLVELAHNPPPGVGFPRTARTLAEAIAARAGVRIDTSVYDTAHLIRLPNTRHPRTGLFKRRIDADALFRLDVPRILEHARHPAGDGIPAVRSCPAELATDWQEAERAAARAAEARYTRRGTGGGPADARAPRYFLDLLRFGVAEGERHGSVFRNAAWLTEQGAPAALVSAILSEPGCDVGLSPKDVARQIQCGIEHARRQRRPVTDPQADPNASAFALGGVAPAPAEGGAA